MLTFVDEKVVRELDRKKQRVIESITMMITFLQKNRDRPQSTAPVKIQRMRDYVPKAVEEVVMIPINSSDSSRAAAHDVISQLPSDANARYLNTNVERKEEPKVIVSIPAPVEVKPAVKFEEPKPGMFYIFWI